MKNLRSRAAQLYIINFFSKGLSLTYYDAGAVFLIGIGQLG